MDGSGLRRVVITGLGVVSPLGIGWKPSWAAAKAGTSTAAPISLFDPAACATHFACEVPGFDPEEFLDKKAVRRMDRFSQLAVAAARLGMDDSGIEGSITRDRMGVMIGSGIGGIETFHEQTVRLRDLGPTRVSPLFIPTIIANMGAAQASMALGLQGPLSCATTACASSNHAIGDAFDHIRLGRADAMIAGGTEGAVTLVGVAGFNAMKALSTRNDDPATASRPFDTGRDGFVMGEAGAVLVLEEMNHAISRGADIICELVGYGLSGDAHHITEPDPTAAGPALAMAMALDDAGIDVSEVDYINAHGTSTPVGDSSEVRVIKRAFGEEKAARTMVSSTKSMHGHCLGAAGGLEAALTALAVREGVVPPTINVTDLDPECTGVDHVLGVSRTADVRVALSNVFGFGGHNATLAFRRMEG
ncbi:MAG: beta-ketoacyl-[acyl-carrier-protein] synthase II [Thermoleophilia bacterium]|nr:beta-ketoacyl-[acyl-carrier-protein] synthase II [Thermoleophilia bacterium]